ncbi:MAG: hypothetical protein Q8M01_01305 [Rubrivivax sp.]|nr:hypothetical protein [Rubrivivax sp.]
MLQESEWGRDADSLNVENLPSSPTSTRNEIAVDDAAHSAKGRWPQPGLFDAADT